MGKGEKGVRLLAGAGAGAGAGAALWDWMPQATRKANSLSRKTSRRGHRRSKVIGTSDPTRPSVWGGTLDREVIC